MKTINLASVRAWLADSMKRDQIELRLWRECYPHRARFIREEAAAEAEGRKPKYIEPIAIW